MRDIFRAETVITVDAFDLQNFITNAWDLSHDFEILEMPNDSEHKFTVSAKEPSDYEVSDLSTIRERGNCDMYSLGTVLDSFCRSGLIEPGTYLVEVCW